MKQFRSAITFLILFGTVTCAQPVPQLPPSSELLKNAAGQNDSFAAIGRLRASLTCTGSLINPSSSVASDAKAWLLTAGHCVSLEPYGVIRNLALTAAVQFNYFVDTQAATVTIRARTVGWSTMKGVDLALIELDATLGDLLSKGIRPLRISAADPQAGDAVFWTGIPGSPIPSEMQFLRLGRCTLGPRVQLLEGSWIWTDELSNDCPDLYEGASGAPVFDAASGEVMGVIGTSTLLNFEQGPDYDCQVNRPCVLCAGGPMMQTNTSYASPVYGIAQCFDQANALDPQRPGCPLDPGFQLTIKTTANEVQPEVDGTSAIWNAALSGSQRYYAYKHFSIGANDCAALSGYSGPISVASAPIIGDPVGSADGYYLLCVIAGDTPAFDASWQQPSHASVRFKRLDGRPPTVLVDYEVEPLAGMYRLMSTGGDGTSDLGITLSKSGPLSATDCSDPNGYGFLISIPQTVRPSDMPLRICWKFSDKAGNYADPAVFDFGPPAMLPNAARNAASLERGFLAPGSAFRADTFNLTEATEFSQTPLLTLAGVRMSVIDAAGRSLPVGLTAAGALFLEGVIPLDVAPGPATLIVHPPQAPALSQSVTIRPTVPGLYFDPGSGGPVGFAVDATGNPFPLFSCVANAGCFATHLPLSSTTGGLDFVFYGTGARASARPVKMRIGTHVIDSVEIFTHPDYAGVDEFHFHMPQDFPLRLYQAVAAETPDGTSNYLWIYLE